MKPKTLRIPIAIPTCIRQAVPGFGRAVSSAEVVIDPTQPAQAKPWAAYKMCGRGPNHGLDINKIPAARKDKLQRTTMTTRIAVQGRQSARRLARLFSATARTYTDSSTPGVVARCPAPDHDTGCTYCEPPDMSLFGEPRDPRGTAPLAAKFVIVKTGTSGKYIGTLI